VTQFFGKYRGKVENNIDPLMLGRVQVSVSAVLGDGRLSWAMPCAPYAGAGVGFFAVPPVGGNVWVEFEGGDPDYPIWTGCFWGVGEVPALPAIPQMKVLKTDGITLTLSDLPGAGGFTLEVNPPVVPIPLKLVFNAAGIELTNSAASVKLTPVSVSLNNGALEVI
jgi:Type VI secretion system/phage-baseplate injector OB domain